MKESKLQFTLPWGRVYSTKHEVMIFKGSPDKYVNSLVETCLGNLAEALLFIDRTVPQTIKDPFFAQVRNIILNRLAGKKRSDRKPAVVTEPVAIQ